MIEMLPIFPVCPWTSRMIRDIYNFKFAVVCKIWVSQGKVKSPIIWDVPNIWKLNTTGISNQLIGAHRDMIILYEKIEGSDSHHVTSRYEHPQHFVYCRRYKGFQLLTILALPLSKTSKKVSRAKPRVTKKLTVLTSVVYFFTTR